MSASNEDKIQREQQRQEQRAKQAKADRRAMIVYTVVGAVVVLAAITMMVLSSGILQRTLTAAQVDGRKYNAVEVQYYYNSVYAQTWQQAVQNTGIPPFDSNTSLKKQVYDAESGQSWHDFLLDQAVDALAADTALADQAAQEGYQLSDDAQRELDQFIAQLDTAWITANYPNQKQFIRANYGPHMTYELLEDMVLREVTANDYLNTQLEAIQHSEDDYQTYYQDNKTALDTFTLDQFTFLAEVDTVDADGNELEADAVADALEQQKEQKKALAEELLAKLEAGADPQQLADEYAQDLVSSSVGRQSTGADLRWSTYADWILDEGRTAGDSTLAENAASSSSHYYYVVRFNGRELDQTPTHDVRHILVAAQQDQGASEPTQAQYDAAKEQAQQLLDQWKADGATQESFAQLAAEHSADRGSASKGGLIQGVTEKSGYVDTFKDWVLDPARQSGDTGLVQNTGSSVKGWHIMYYVGSADPTWRRQATDQFQQDDRAQLEEQAAQSVEVSTGAGLKLIQD